MIEAKVIADSINEHETRLITFQVIAPKFIDAQCVSGDTLLHFERHTGVKNANGEDGKSLATMSVAEFYDKWVNGIEILLSTQRNHDISNVDPNHVYRERELSDVLGKHDEFVGSLRRNAKTVFPSIVRSDGARLVKGSDFIKWCNESRNSVTNHMRDYKKTLSSMSLRCVDIDSFKKTTTSIVDIWQSGEKPVYTVKSGGNSIKASANHPFLTQRGWVLLEDLDVEEDTLVMVTHTGMYAGREQRYEGFNRKNKSMLLEKQGNKCLYCGCYIDKSCDVHHVKPVSTHPELMFDEDNIVCLCRSCHVESHIKLGKSSTSPKFYRIDSIEYVGKEMTYDLEVEHTDHNFVANGFVVHNCRTHRMLSQNSSSDRAVPFSKIAIRDMYLPTDVRKNQKGMQGYEKIEEYENFVDDLRGLFDETVYTLSRWKDKVHKQHLNRYLLGFTMQDKVISGTEWDNFFNLRLASDAQPEIQVLALRMKEAMDNSIPKILKPGEWHLPYVTEETDIDTAIKCSAARCARVSYSNHDGSEPDIEKDIKLYDMLVSSSHFSPLEHQATPMQMMEFDTINDSYPDTWEKGVSHIDKNFALWSGTFKNWIQYRKIVE